MQLNISIQETDAEREGYGRGNSNPVLAEYERRRCAVCGARYPAFGFGPPLTQKEVALWACAAHWREVERQLRASGQLLSAEGDDAGWGRHHSKRGDDQDSLF